MSFYKGLKNTELFQLLFTSAWLYKIIGALVIIQVAAQDIGIRTGIKQAELMTSYPFQIIALYSSALVVTNDVVSSFLGTLLYYFLKLVISRDETGRIRVIL